MAALAGRPLQPWLLTVRLQRLRPLRRRRPDGGRRLRPLAPGHLKLSICWIDDNKITIGLDLSGVRKTLRNSLPGYKLECRQVEDANDAKACRPSTCSRSDRPATLIVPKATSPGAPNAEDTHGAAARGRESGTKGGRLAAGRTLPRARQCSLCRRIGQRGQKLRRLVGQFAEYRKQYRVSRAVGPVVNAVAQGWDASEPYPAAGRRTQLLGKVLQLAKFA